MKITLLTLGAASLFLLSTSCRTFVPIDPDTGKPACRMMPTKPCCDGPDCTPCSCKVAVKATK